MSGTWIYSQWDELISLSRSFNDAAYKIPIYIGELEYKTLDSREVCEYCHGFTKMDDRGNCVACGAPKPQSPIFVRNW